jgi:hypothetical protein
MAISYRIAFLKNSLLKQEPIQSSQLPSYKRQDIPAGTVLPLTSYGVDPFNPDHYKVTLEDIKFKDYGGTWYAFIEHVDIFQEPFTPVTNVDELLAQQVEKDVVKIYAQREVVGNQQGFLKLVFNVETLIKRKPVDSRFLNEQSKQVIPAGTELILLTQQPDSNNIVRFKIEDNHVKFSLKDIELKGFSQDWYAFDQHVGIERVG